MLGGVARAPACLREPLWTIHGTIDVVEAAIRAEAERKAKFIVASNVPATQRGAEDLVRLYKAQSGIERGFAFRECPPLLGLVRFCQESRAGDGDRVRDGALTARFIVWQSSASANAWPKLGAPCPTN
jgi:hypothetical protein